jgi:hypothetical protein
VILRKSSFKISLKLLKWYNWIYYQINQNRREVRNRVNYGRFSSRQNNVKVILHVKNNGAMKGNIESVLIMF